MQIFQLLVYLLLPVCIIAGYFICIIVSKKKQSASEKRIKELILESQREAEKIRKEAELAVKAELYQRREAFEKETQETKMELRQQEKRLSKREDNLERKMELLTKKERYIDTLSANFALKEKKLDEKRLELENAIEEENKALLKISNLSKDDAEKLLLSRLEKELDVKCSELISKKISETKENAEQTAISLISTAIQRCAATHTAENIVSAIELPNNEMKGRIIGREGRNIRAFEKATGIDVIVDDTPGVIVLSGFDSVRREIARQSMEKLILDGRIHPAHIEEVVKETEKEIEQIIQETGKQTCFELGIHNVNPELIKLLGRLKYRTSYGQNQLQHSIEVSNLMGIIAGELKLDVSLAKRCGLFHDIGKAIGPEMEGTHAVAGADLAKRYDERPEVVNAIAGHHEEAQIESVYTVLVSAADAISAGRPGARRETLEKYIKRLEKLENIATSFGGVEGAYAIQAGREIRVMVCPEKVNDKVAAKMCYDIAKEIEEQLEYPGEVIVTVIRETRFIEHAK
ncbi:MAG: ribonuclease Y [Candidatus Jettenia sp.]|uniref:Ribonuclease Y n=1 Tax=Candidatus Jettenia caeni TaxID=247490 RepID=I3IJW2_9BACT|nr:ribonuclease Y [Candidatus Jettenia sp. AMX1]MBC6927800.1 ribonuclease Y [Candidatus Jettenia sp.]NUN22382.1 ribonuclease Y [Candidatus Jettenia caeni]KAA0250287.1 MAG: ribonuclease Y [Candidatus Jettenia sp. AMX1]MCE7879457.1 ribonuclease Y [Candidatus Jettenia sp. AMX1]MCQ3926121.1 ribonuclease Y [Candidatus Jettenia sp.]